jgi:hypothetical protein
LGRCGIEAKGCGQLPRPSAAGAGFVGRVYLVEQIWKTALVPQWRNDALDSLLTQNVAGPLVLWHAVWANAPGGPLKNLAAHLLPNDPSNDTRNLLAGVLAKPGAAAETKQAILTGLAVASPAYTTSVLLQTLSSWEEISIWRVMACAPWLCRPITARSASTRSLDSQNPNHSGLLR